MPIKLHTQHTQKQTLEMLKSSVKCVQKADSVCVPNCGLRGKFGRRRTKRGYNSTVVHFSLIACATIPPMMFAWTEVENLG